MRRFLLVREGDPSGVSGTGIVAEGVQFSDGITVMRWLRSPFGLNVYAGVEDLLAVHGHGGASFICWIDEGESESERTSRVESVSDRGQTRPANGFGALPDAQGGFSLPCEDQ